MSLLCVCRYGLCVGFCYVLVHACSWWRSGVCAETCVVFTLCDTNVCAVVCWRPKTVALNELGWYAPAQPPSFLASRCSCAYLSSPRCKETGASAPHLVRPAHLACKAALALPHSRALHIPGLRCSPAEAKGGQSDSSAARGIVSLHAL